MTGAMTNGLALFLIAAVAGFFVLDHTVLHLDAGLVLARKGLDLIGWLAFWR